MSQRIYQLDDDQSLRVMQATDYASEDLLQRLLASAPELLDGHLIDPEVPRRWLLVRREAAVSNEETGGRWSLDHLLLDQDGIPTLVEVKRASDTRSRREVVAQMLDYAANAVKYWPAEELRGMLDERCVRDGLEADEHLAARLALDSADNGLIDHYWQQVKTNLLAGRIRMIFVADRIQPELRRIIEFLNEQMDPAEVLGLEVRQFTDGQVRTLVPAVVGHTSASELRKAVSSSVTAGEQWTEETFLERMRELNGDAAAEVAQGVLAWGRKNTTRVWFGRGRKAANFVPILNHMGTDHQAFALSTGSVPNSASVELYFHWYARKPPFSSITLRREMLTKLNEVDGVSLPEDAITRQPKIPLDLLADDGPRRQFLTVMDWYLEQIRQSS